MARSLPRLLAHVRLQLKSLSTPPVRFLKTGCGSYERGESSCSPCWSGFTVDAGLPTICAIAKRLRVELVEFDPESRRRFTAVEVREQANIGSHFSFFSMAVSVSRGVLNRDPDMTSTSSRSDSSARTSGSFDKSLAAYAAGWHRTHRTA